MKAIALLALVAAVSAQAETVESRFVDGLGRPVGGVDVTVSVWRPTKADDDHTLVLFRGVTEDDGCVRLVWDEKKLRSDETPSVKVEKEGYEGFSGGPQEQYELRKNSATTFADVAALPEEQRTDALRELLAAERSDSDQDDPTRQEEALRAPLRALVADERVGRTAIELIAEGADRADIDFLIAHRPAIVPDGPDYDYSSNRWAYAVAMALVAPETDAEWSFLAECASGAHTDMWVDAGAIVILAMADRSRAGPILREAAQRNEDRREWISTILEKGEPIGTDALASHELEPMPKLLGTWLAGTVGRFTGASEPKLNVARDKATVELQFRAGGDLLIHTATYERGVDGLWRLRGVRETKQFELAG